MVATIAEERARGLGAPTGDGLAISREVARFATALVRPVADACAVVALGGERGGREIVADIVAIGADEPSSAATRVLAEAIATSSLPPLRRLLAARRPFVLHAGDAALAEPAVRDALAAIDARSIAVVPFERHPWGFVLLASATPDRWDAHDAATLRALGRALVALFARDDVRAALEELLADIHHDLGNPLHAICLSVELLLGTPPEHDRRAGRATLEQLRQAARRMSQLLGELDEYLHGRSHPEAATTTDVARAVDEVIATLQPLAAERAIELAREVDAAVGPVAIAPRHLYRVLANLVGNAVKYADEATTVRVSAAAATDGRVRLAVADRGPGIAADDCRRLFDRAWLARSALRKGSGLGLAIAKRLVEAHGGAITVDSEPGRGTTFAVELPRSDGGVTPSG